MSPRQLLPLLSALALVAATAISAPPTHAADPAPKPKKVAVKDLQALIGAKPSLVKGPHAALAKGLSDAATWRMSHVIGETSTGLIVAIGLATDPIEADDPAEEEGAWERASNLHKPLAFTFQRQPDGTLTAVSGIALPTIADPHDQFGWGFSKLDDVDGDGRPELAVVYGYLSYYPGSTFGTMNHKQIAWLAVSDTTLTVQANLETESRLGDNETPDSKVTYRLVPQPNSAFKDLRVTTETESKKTSVLWTYDPKADAWVAPK